MKTPQLSPFHLARLKRDFLAQRSSALIIVLGCMALISVLIVGFFYSVTAERQSAQFYANTASVKLLADSTVSIVMGKIKDATKGTDINGNTLAWASQPGMIRTFDQTAQTVGYYKLYSWANMYTTSFNPTASTEIPSTSPPWNASPAIYTDLNEPVQQGASLVYPIVDPAATNMVKGFSITSAPVFTTNAAPMPVQWLYVLQYGQVLTPDTGNTGNTATFQLSPVQPSATNMIVGRVAFWTDDDTCKVNVNTAAGDVWVNSSSPPAIGAPGNPGSFWDTPRVGTGFDVTNLAYYQPANGEYQRYPGHPATTYLSSIFTNFTSAQIYALSPRVTQGGSYSGTTYATNSMVSSDDNDRLYSSPDELLFTTTRTPNASLTKTTLEQARFFLTAHSRAPEVNLYNEPRVVVWPVNAQTGTPTYRTAYDNLIAYCGSLPGTNYTTGAFNTNAYYFQRTSSTSPTTDLPTAPSASGVGRNRALITYLRNLTTLPVPGFSASSSETFRSKYTLDRDQILAEIFDYIRTENTQDPLVTAANTFTLSSYGGGEGQVVPITDSGTDNNNNVIPLRGFGHMPVITEASLLFVGTGETSGTNSTVFPAAASPPADKKVRIQAAFFVNLYDPCPNYGAYIPNFRISVTGLDSLKWNGASAGFRNPAYAVVNCPTDSAWPSGESGIGQLVQASGYSSASTGFISQNTLDCTNSANGGLFSTSDTSIVISIQNSAGTATYQTYNLTLPGGTFPVPQVAPLVTDQSTSTSADFRNLTTSSVGGVFPRFSTYGVASRMLQTYICGKDVVRSIVLANDPRLVAASTNIPSSFYSKISGYDSTSVMQAHGINPPDNGSHRPYVGAIWGKLVKGASYYNGSAVSPYFPTNIAGDFQFSPVTNTPGIQPQASSPNTSTSNYSGNWKGAQVFSPYVFTLAGGYANGANGVSLASTSDYAGGVPGDWDNGTGNEPDGAYINKVDEGTIPYSTQYPYYGAGYATNATGAKAVQGIYTIAGGASFSPNRQMPSAGMFGSLPTGVKANRPWQTLLFRPDPDGSKTHIGAQSPQDHLFLDLFNMPIVEPYAISDPFSTAGKINMNYQIVPFGTYMTRNTGIQAVMRSEQILAIPATAGLNYKGTLFAPNLRHYIDIDQTLTGFTTRFSNNDIFRSPSEICNIWLVPAGLTQTYSSMQNFWNSTTASGGAMTGDNSRERPYANLYPRLTTKSNSFTVHMRVQTLKQVKIADPTYATWVENSDVVTGEYRGSSTLERYLDTSDKRIPDYATLTQPLSAGQAIDNFYKFRVVETKQFTP